MMSKSTRDQLEFSRQKLIALLLDHMSNTDCCRQIPNWRERMHQLTLPELKRKYKKIFGVDYET